MATNSLRSSGNSFKRSVTAFTTTRDPLLQCLAPRLSRSMATEVQLPQSEVYSPFTPTILRRPPPPVPNVLATVYSFPHMEPLRFTEYPANQLHLPLRRDILQRAVVYEADGHRGMRTANTKWRSEVHGSSRKIRPQKGTGRARLGDKKSPMLRGGGVAFGPKPRDMSTKLPRKIYDLAWRTALSYRYRRGELIVVQKIADIENEDSRWMEQIMQWNHWGKEDGRSLIVSRRVMPKLYEALNGGKEQPGCGRHGIVKEEADIDVKDLLELGRVVIEKRSLDAILREHSSDLNRRVPSAVRR
ncbi:MAG: 54S ribosomal protein, mitochondrial [Alectoria fallacina]|uniref:Large ribosomal subunit protein uL4m n=1 Tax=Alectoria fallacina TaxID=1903189 RepID=A0A8H3G7Q8_9LECA|nr:MAG: 54S ribosomal protein, mitochondrial [Alectoria fallacina]